MARCESCRGTGSVFVDRADNRVPSEMVFILLACGVPLVEKPCLSCIGGISSCCDGAVGGPDEVTNAS